MIINTSEMTANGVLEFDSPDVIGILMNVLTPLNSIGVDHLKLHTADSLSDFDTCTQVSDAIDEIGSILTTDDPQTVIHEASRINPLFAVSTRSDIEASLSDPIEGENGCYMHIVGVTDPIDRITDDSLTFMVTDVTVTSDSANAKFRATVNYVPFRLPDMEAMDTYFAKHESTQTLH